MWIIGKNMLRTFTFSLALWICLKSKSGFFTESEIRFSNLPISHKNYYKKLSWAWNLNKLFTAWILNFKLRIGFWNIFLFWKKDPFSKVLVGWNFLFILLLSWYLIWMLQFCQDCQDLSSLFFLVKRPWMTLLIQSYQ